MPSPKTIIKIENLTKTFKGAKSAALENINCQIKTGEITGLVGPDGAGKSTLIRLMVGLLKLDNGKILVNNYNPQNKEVQQIHKFSAYMPQNFGLYEDLTVLENLNLYADLRALKKEEKEESFQNLLKFTNLENFTKRLASKLSGGMKQKLGLACALLGNPKILFLDEPTVGVDPISRRELWHMMQILIKQNITVIWSTSYLDEAEKCASVLLLNNGKLLYQGSPKKLLNAVNDRTWEIKNIKPEERRLFLLNILKSENVSDALIYGQNIKVTLKTNIKPKIEKGIWQKTQANFEDGFINILGGQKQKESALAKEIIEKPKSNVPIVEAVNLSKNFGNFTAVKNNNFKIYRGEIFGLLGPNGAGKSTTFKMMCGLLKPSSGHALIDGLSFEKTSSLARSKIGYMAQHFSLYRPLSVQQNLKFFSGVYGLTGKKQKEQINLMLNIFNLEKYAQTNAENLPLGYKQRLALACAIMHQPDVLFLDEPSSGVDPLTRREFWLHINAMVQKGVTVMVTTHFMEEAEYCDKIALIYKGESIAHGSPQDLKKLNPESENKSLEDAFIHLIEKAEKVN